eukprot:gene13229-17729_t
MQKLLSAHPDMSFATGASLLRRNNDQQKQSSSVDDFDNKNDIDIELVESTSVRSVEYTSGPVAPKNPKPSSKNNKNKSSADQTRKATNLSPYRQQIKFTAYRSNNPELLSQVNLIVENGLSQIKHQFDDMNSPRNIQINFNNNSNGKSDSIQHQFAKLEIYKLAFQKFIDHFTIYGPFLNSVKKEYDKTISIIQTTLESFTNIDVQSAMKEQEWISKFKQESMISDNKAKELKSQISNLENQLLIIQKQHAAKDNSYEKLLEQNKNLRKDCDEMRSTCITLTNSLSRLEDDRRMHQSLEATTQAEMLSLKVSEQKNVEEMERLQQTISNLEQIQAGMVSIKVISEHEATIHTLQTELKKIENSQRQVLVRYATLKAVVDMSFKKWTEADNKRSSEIKTNDITDDINKINRRVHDIVEDPSVTSNTRPLSMMGSAGGRRTRSSKRSHLTDPTDKLMAMVEKGSNPRLIVESLLNHIDNYRSESHDAALLASIAIDTAKNDSNQENAINNAHVSSTISYDVDKSHAEEFKSPWLHFEGYGTEESVPSYLWFNGKVQNLWLSRRDIIRIINELWKAKQMHTRIGTNMNIPTIPSISQDNDNNNINNNSRGITPLPQTAATNEKSKASFSRPESSFARSRASTAGGNGITAAVMAVQMNFPVLKIANNASWPVFFEAYLEEKFKDRLLTIEMAYNIVDTLKRHHEISDCMLFSSILEMKLSDEIWHDMTQMVDIIVDEMFKENSAVSTTPENDWKLTQESFLRILRRLLPNKAEASFQKLSKALSFDMKGNRYINPVELFSDDEITFEKSHFHEQLRIQHIHECMAFEKHLLENVLEMPIGRYREALQYADPNLNRSEINHLLSRGCGVSLEEMLLLEAKRQPIPLEDFKKKIKNGLLKKSFPKGNMKN